MLRKNKQRLKMIAGIGILLLFVAYLSSYLVFRSTGYLTHYAGYSSLLDGENIEFAHRVRIGTCPYHAAGTIINPNNTLPYHWNKKAEFAYSFTAPCRWAECKIWMMINPTYDWKINHENKA